MVQYKWVALSNTTLGTLMASIDATIVLIALPAIFRGININPFTSFQYMLWILFGYSIVTATLLVTFGRLSDMFGRVRLYNLGFAIFTVGSILCSITPSLGDAGAIELIVFRIIQGVGGAFLFANSAAIITDAFPINERGKALGINQISFLAGSLVGLVLGGILAVYDWRLVFIVSVPVGVVGTVWSYLKLKERGTIRKNQKLDVWGNLAFGAGLTLILAGVIYGLIPYGNSAMGWSNPWVIAALVSGAGLLIAFPFIESHVAEPMFRLELFKIRAFSAGNLASVFSSMSRGGVLIMLIILLQGIWLPLHGYSYSSTPFWCGILMIPMSIGFVVTGPISGYLSDKHGARLLATVGMLISAAAFMGFILLPANFLYLSFAAVLFIMGLGGGVFASPNMAAVMNSVPAEHRGAASGMRATLQNSAMTISQAVFFTIIIVSLTTSLPGALSTSVMSDGAPATLAKALSATPASAALFASFLGYNPVATILQNFPASALNAIPKATINFLTGPSFFPNAISSPFMAALREAFIIGAAMCVIAAVCSVLRGQKYVNGQQKSPE
ncbi:MAG TPA: MFS transporter [Candidatus Limnocylindrales bacterium]|nr:MFS transporter [Candidatus Limnocylindrales bacterium]